jgi:hypothetical protein
MNTVTGNSKPVTPDTSAEIWSKVAYGAQNDIMKEFQNAAIPTVKSVISTETVIVSYKKPYKTIRVDEFINKDTVPLGIANIRVKALTDNAQWRYELVMGGQIIDVVSSNHLNGPSGPWMCRDDRVLPFQKYHEVRLNVFVDVWGTDSIEISYDIVVTDCMCNDRGSYSYGTIMNHSTNAPEYIDANDISGSTSVIRCDLSHPTYKVYVKTSARAKDIYLTFDPEQKDRVGSFMHDESSDVWICTFQEPEYDSERHVIVDPSPARHINLSRVPQIYLHVTWAEDSVAAAADDPIKVKYWNEYYNCITHSSGMCGLRFGR